MRAGAFACAALLAAVCGPPAPVAAAPGREAEASVGELRAVKGWPLESFRPIGTATLADLDGDGRPEILTLAARVSDPFRIVVLALRADGKALKGWPQPAGMPLPNPAGPVVGDVDGDGKLEVVVTDGARVGIWATDGRVRAAAPIPGGGVEIHTHGEAALADLDGDGRLELLFATWGPNVVALRLARGVEHLPGSPLKLAGPFGAAPAVADLDGDGRDEAVIPDESGSCYFIRWRPEGALVERARDRDGAPLKLTSRAAPVIADLGDGAGLTVLLGSNEGQLFALDAQGRERWRFQVPERSRYGSISIVAAPIVADLDGDGRREVVFAAYDGLLRALTAEGRPLAGWTDSGLERLMRGLAAADLDGDGQIELVAPGEYGTVHFFRADGTGFGFVEGPSWSPLIGDLDGDRRLELVLPLVGKGIAVLRLPGAASAAVPWPMPRGDAHHSGAVPRPAAAAGGAR